MRIGLPKGRLRDRGAAAMERWPLVLPDVPAKPMSLRMQDIPDLVADGLLDVAVTSDEWLVESRADVVRVAPLCWYHVRICAIGRPSPLLGDPVRVVSEYPNIARDYAEARWPGRFVQRTVRGATEEYLPDLADIAVECVETGQSIRRRGLVVLETLFEADVWLVCSAETARAAELVEDLRTWASHCADHEREGCPSGVAVTSAGTPGAAR